MANKKMLLAENKPPQTSKARRPVFVCILAQRLWALLKMAQFILEQSSKLK